MGLEGIQMLNKDGIRRAVLDRLTAIDNNCNSTHYAHNMGVIRGLLWVLNENDPGTLSHIGTESILKLADIPCREVGEQIEHSTPGDADWPTDTPVVPIKT